jgi:chromate transporter
MARALAPDRERASLTVLAAMVALMVRTATAQVLIIVAAGLVGRWLLPAPGMSSAAASPVPVSKRIALTSLGLFVVLLTGLPIARYIAPAHALAVFDSFYRAGSLVFGGGHVVLPLLEAEVVPPGWVTSAAFIAGYGAAQAVPGPLFTFAAYLGAVMHEPPNGWFGGGWALIAVFLPSLFLVIGALPFWEALRVRAGVQSALRGINAAVVGLVLAALYDPLWSSAVTAPADFALALVAFGLLVFWKLPPWLVVLITAAGGSVVSALR